MAFDPQIKMSIQNKAGDYYVAAKALSGAWSVTTTSTLTYLNALPEGWEESSTTWERDTSYMGVFRSKGNDNFQFTEDGRAILQHIMRTQGLLGYGTLNICMLQFDGAGISYPIFYSSQFDFKTYSDSMQHGKLSISTLDSNLVRNLHAYGDTKYNIPVWKETPGWELNDAVPVWHDGIRLLYNATFVSDATEDNPVSYTVNGFDQGNHGTHQGVHTIPAMTQYSITQNNGSTTYIGNTILAALIIQGQQIPYPNEVNFHDATKPFTTNSFCIKSLVSASFSFVVAGKFSSPIIRGVGDPDGQLRFVIFEVDDSDEPPVVSGEYQIFNTIHTISLTTTPYTMPGDGRFQSAASTATLHPERVYVFAIIYDGSGSGITTSAPPCTFTLTDLQLSVLSNYDYGQSGVPIPAPKFPGSITLGFRLHTLLEKLVPYMDTLLTDSYGFPIGMTTEFAGHSDFLSDPASYAGGDCWPHQILLTSSYCMHNLAGRSYLTTSFNQIFDFCKKQLGCGAYIKDNTLYVEPLSKIFDSSTMILDLGYDVTDLVINHMTEEIGANLKIGYSAADTNSNFGVDPFNTQLYFNTPVAAVPGTMDYQESNIVTERYAIEILRAQKASQPLGSSINPESPSRDNQTIALYCEGFTSSVIRDVYDPENNLHHVSAYDVKMYSDAQCTDPSAATAVYIAGLYYPQDAVNINLSPCRALQREVGALLHSVLDNMDSESLMFRNTYIMQFNNTTLGLTGIQSNIMIGAGFTPILEFGDKLIGDLPPQLFRPIQVKIKTKYPHNLYDLLHTNPNGYVRFFWQDEQYGTKEYKFFIDKATQNAATGMAVEFTGRLTPDIVI